MSKLRGIVDKIIDDKITAAMVDSTGPLAQACQRMADGLNAISGRMDSTDTSVQDLTAKNSAVQGATVATREQVNAFADVLAKAVAPTVNPVGTVVQSLLTEPQFGGLSAAGSTWVLCDGRSVAGTAYAQATGRNTVPDLRGAFLRGSGTRTGVAGWAGGALNAHVEDSTRPPRTNFTVTVNDPLVDNTGASGNRGVAGAGWGNTEAYLHPGTSSRTVMGGDPETRPKHYTVNFFVRVD